MKKLLAMLMVLTLAISALVISAMAEDTNAATDATATASIQDGRGGRNGQMPGNGQMPQMPGQNNNRQPGRGGRNGQQPGNGQMPQMPDQNSQNGQQTLPGKNIRGMGHGGRGAQQLFDQLLKENVITQETYDAIIAYLQKNAQQQDGTAAPADGSEAPAAPEAQQEAPEQQMLKDMLDKGIITQEQYDEYMAKLAPAAPADTGEPAGNT